MNLTLQRWTRPLLLAGAALLLLFVVACGDDDGNGDSDATSEPTSAATETSTETPESPEATETAEASPTEGGSGSEGAGQLGELSSQFAEASFSVTYEMSSDVEGEAIDGGFTWYVDAPGQRMRMDFAEIDPSIPGEATMIVTAEETVICFEGACMGGAIPGMDELGTDLFGTVDSVDDVAMQGDVQPAGTRDIAGVEATCFDFTNETEGIETGTVCLSDEGVPLFATWEADTGESFSMEATEYSNSVSDADFEPPYPVMDLPATTN